MTKRHYLFCDISQIDEHYKHCYQCDVDGQFLNNDDAGKQKFLIVI